MVKNLNFIFKSTVAFCLFFQILSCTQRKKDAEGTLEYFIKQRIGHQASRDFVLSHVTGKMKESVKGMSEKDFKNFSDLSHVSQSRFKIISKSCEKLKCFITYTLSFSEHSQDEKEKIMTKSEVKKIAELVYEDEKWLIADVVNMKTYHESLSPLNLNNP